MNFGGEFKLLKYFGPNWKETEKAIRVQFLAILQPSKSGLPNGNGDNYYFIT